MTAFTHPRRRYPKLAVAGLTAWAAAATGVAVYAAQTVHLPDRVCVSSAKPHAAAAAHAPAPGAPVHRTAVSSPAAGQEAPSVPVIDLGVARFE